MEGLYKQGNGVTPRIFFDPESSTLSIKGNSISVDAHHFFADAIHWLERYADQPNDHTKLEIDLKYWNARSIQNIMSMLNQMKKIDQSGKEVRVVWCVPEEAEDLRELTEDILNKLSIPHLILSN